MNGRIAIYSLVRKYPIQVPIQARGRYPCKCISAVRITEQKTKVKVEFMSNHPIRDKMRAALRKAA